MTEFEHLNELVKLTDELSIIKGKIEKFQESCYIDNIIIRNIILEFVDLYYGKSLEATKDEEHLLFMDEEETCKYFIKSNDSYTDALTINPHQANMDMNNDRIKGSITKMIHSLIEYKLENNIKKLTMTNAREFLVRHINNLIAQKVIENKLKEPTVEEKLNSLKKYSRLHSLKQKNNHY